MPRFISPFVMLPRPLQESNVVGKGGTAGFLGKAYDPYYLYGYGAFGLGSYYYDPFWWGYPYGYGYYGGYPWGYYGGYAGGGYYDYDRHQDEGVKGGLKLKVKPSNADVFVDGYFVGRVDDYEPISPAHNSSIVPPQVECLSLGPEITGKQHTYNCRNPDLPGDVTCKKDAAYDKDI